MRTLLINLLVLAVGAIAAKALFGSWLRPDPVVLLNLPMIATSFTT